MSRTLDTGDAAFKASLPPELRDLDGELSGLRIDERPSFGPELEGELMVAARGTRDRAVWPWARILLAACLGGVMLAGVGVPSARGAMARLVRTVLEEAAPGLLTPPEPVLPEVMVPEPTPEPTVSSAHAVVSPLALEPADDEGEGTPAPELMTEVEYSLPELLHRAEAEALIQSFYPMALQRLGVGGTVDLLIWVDSLGVPDLVQFQNSSGSQSLDRAAMRAAYQLRFRPAQRAGIPVGTWVEFKVHFVPPEGGGGHEDPVREETSGNGL